jgi:chromosome partitioning protein
MPTTTVCFINQKGGCGKSSSTYHLGGALAAKGLNTLLVDCDPQGSLSQAFFGSAAVETLSARDTLAAVFDPDAVLDDPARLTVPTGFDRLDILRANQTLAPYNRPEPEREGLNQFLLRDALADIAGYDLILLDCPPNLYLASWNAMLASDHVVIPVPPEDFGAQGLRVVHQAIDQASRLNPRLRLTGHLVTRCDGRLAVHRAYEEKLRTLYRETVFDAVVPEASAFKVALACRTPVSHHMPGSKAARVMGEVADELLARIAAAADTPARSAGAAVCDIESVGSKQQSVG